MGNYYFFPNCTAIERLRKMPKVTKEWTDGAESWTRAAWLQNTALREVFHVLSTETNVPTSFTLIFLNKWLATKQSTLTYGYCLHKIPPLLACFINKGITQSWHQLLPHPRSWSTRSCSHQLHQTWVSNPPFPWASRTCLILGLPLSSALNSLTWLPRGPPLKHPTSTWPPILWKYRSHLIILLLYLNPPQLSLPTEQIQTPEFYKENSSYIPSTYLFRMVSFSTALNTV